MAGNEFTIVGNLLLKVNDAEAGINKLKSSLSKLEVPKGLENSFNKSFANLDDIFTRYRAQLQKGFDTKGDVSNITKIGKELDTELSRMSEHFKQLTGQNINFKIDTAPVKQASKDLEEVLEKRRQLVQEKLELKVDSSKEGINNIKQLLEEFQRVVGDTKAGRAAGQALSFLNTGDIEKAIPLLKEAENNLSRIGTKKQQAFSSTGFTFSGALEKIIAELKTTDGELGTVSEKAKVLQDVLAKVQAGQLQDAQALLEKMSQSFEKNAQSARSATKAGQEYAQATFSMQQQVNQLQQSTQYFFSLRNMINLLKRGLREAIDTIKELDKAMTETAVVTKFSVGDMWAKLPEYTANANALGATVQSMYEATTLYYQQGLNAQQAMEIANETMKMARIGGLEAATATDMMTAALRGFNMELNETSAQRINDVYSNLAAKTASNTKELGTAMQRTASIAASAGMSFEGTAAFLAQAIETTREPAENLGTAMKTIVARFQELKKNPLEITEVEGEEVSYNKVDAALQSIGVSLKDANGQFRDLDKVFLDISKRWDSLTQTQQRYIATTAAGSRQQSRFIAMMSNYERTMQLMDYANNAEGASGEQFNKTLDSLEAKLNKFQNAWKQFLMNIMNDSFAKGIVSTGTKILDVVNKIINALSLGGKLKGVKSILSIFTAFTGLKMAGKGVNALLGGLGGMITPGSSFSAGFANGALGGSTNKIVQAIYSLIPHIDGAAKANISKNTAYSTKDEYKNARNEIKGLLGGKFGSGVGNDNASYSINNIRSIVDKNNLNDKQLSALLASSPGLKRNLSKGLSEVFQKAGADPQTTRGLVRGITKGTISIDEALVKSGAAKTFSQKMEELTTTKGGKAAAEHFQNTAIKALREEGVVAKIQAEAQQKATEAAKQGVAFDKKQYTRDKINTALNKKVYDIDPSVAALLGEQRTLTNAEKLANVTGAVGGALTSAGMSLQMFGSQLAATNPILGEAVMRMGGLLTAVGALPNMISALVAGGPAVWAITGAVIALGSAFMLVNGEKKKIKKAAEEVVSTYENTTKEINDKIDHLKSAKSVFSELAYGVDEFGNNISLSSDDYARYLETTQELAKIAPELIRGYDAQGNAILATGSAVDELIAKEEQLKTEAIKDFTSDTSLNSLMEGIRISDAFKDIASYNLGDVSSYFTKDTSKISKALASAGIDNFNNISQQLFGREINIFEPSQDDLRLLAAHYDDILNLINTENRNLTDSQKLGLEKAFSSLGENWNAITEEIQPLSQALNQYLSSEGLDTIGLGLGEEFTASFNQGLQSLTIDAVINDMSPSEMKDAVKEYAVGFKEMTQEGSEYATIMEQVTAAQDEYNESLGDPNALNNYKNAIEEYATQLEDLANKYDDGSASGQLFADTLRNTANSIRNYATESVVDLGHALNTLSDEFESARGVEERFKKATENGDFYTAAEGYKSVIDTVLDEKNSAGNGSITGWTGAEEILGSNFVDTHSWDEIVEKIQSIAPMFEDGIAGVQKFGDFLKEAAGESGKELEGLGKVAEDGLFHFDDIGELEEGQLDKFAEKLDLSRDALAALIDKSRQFVAWNTSDMPAVRKALEQGNQSLLGENGKLYTSESSFKEEAKQQGIFGENYTRTKDELESTQNVELLTVKSLTTKDKTGFGLDKVLDNIGLKGADKTLDNVVAVLTQMGFSLEEQQDILTTEGISLADGEIDKDQIAESYNEQAYALENPTVAGIANDTGVIASAANMMLAKMGILTDEAKQKIDQSTSEDNIQGAINTLHPENGFNNSTEHDVARSKVESQIADYNATITALQESGNEALQPYIDKLITARDQLNNALIEDQHSWEEKISDAQSLTEGMGKTVQEQNYLDQHAVDLQMALDSGNGQLVIDTLKQFETEGQLSTQTMLDLGAAISHLDGNETYISQLTALMSNYYEQLKAVRDESYQPFTIKTKLTGDDLINYVSSIDNLSSEEREILVAADLYGDEKVSAFLNEINDNLEGGNETTKSILIEATAKIANGDTAGANELLSGVLGEEKAAEVTSKLEILCEGSVANPSEVQQAIESEIDNLDVNAEVQATVRANVKTTYTGEPPQGGNINYTTNVDTQAIADARTNAEKGAEMPIDAKKGPKYDSVISDLRTIPKTSITVDGKQGTGWTFYATVKPKARGQNYSIPAHQSLSFGAAANGLNLPKKKTSSSGQMTALVGEEGFEVGYIPSEARSIILGANGPEITSFPKDTVIYPHEKSKEIVRRGKGKHITAGSFSSGGIPTSPSNPNNSESSGSNKNKNKGNNNKNKDKTDKDNQKKAKKVIVWWENIARKTEAVQRKADKAYSQFEKYIKSLQATLRETGTKGKGNQYIANMNQVISYNQKQYDKASKELKDLDTSNKKTTIKYGKDKKKKTKLSKFIKYDEKTGAYVIDQKALYRASVMYGKDYAQAVKDEAEKEINEKQSKKNKAEDEIQKAKEALEKFGQELYETFFSWKNELTEILDITSKIEEAQKRISNIDAYDTLLNSILDTGQSLVGTQFDAKRSSFLVMRSKLDPGVPPKTKTTDRDSKIGLNDGNHLNRDSKVSLNDGNHWNLNPNKELIDVLKKTDNDMTQGFSTVDKSIQEAMLKNFENRLKNLKDILEEQAQAITESQRTLLTDLSSYDERQALESVNAILESNELNGVELNESQRLGYEAWAKQLKEQIGIIESAQQFMTVEYNSDGTVSVDVDQDALDQAKLEGRLTGDAYNQIKEYIEQIREDSSALKENYTALTEHLDEYYSILGDLQKQWTEYGEELLSISTEAEQKKIDNLKKLSDSIKNALDKLLKDVKAKLDERRKQEDNAKTERDISQKQQRLAALRADTTGGHQVEIAQLEKEIADAQQDYQRTLEDQLIDQMQQQADEAAEQREKQIALQEAILEATNNAALVDMWMANPQDFEEEIRKAYYEAKGYDDAPQVIKDSIKRSFDSFFTGLKTNQTEQIKVLEEIKNELPKYQQIADEAANSTPIEAPPSNTYSLSEAKKHDLNAQQAYDKFQATASWADIAVEGGYTAQDFADAKVDFKNAFSVFSAKDLKSSGYYKSDDAKQAYEDYKKKISENGKLSDKELLNLQKYANVAGYGAAYYLEDLAKTKELKWKQVINHAVSSKIASASSLAKTFDSSSFKEAFEEIYNKGAWEKYKNNKKGKVLSKTYATGGLADFTGPAWLDGTPSRPELVLNARDTQNFIALKDVLSKVMGSIGATAETYGDILYEININVDKIEKDYDVDRVVDKVKKEIVKSSGYRNVTQVRNLR